MLQSVESLLRAGAGLPASDFETLLSVCAEILHVGSAPEKDTLYRLRNLGLRVDSFLQALGQSSDDLAQHLTDLT